MCPDQTGTRLDRPFDGLYLLRRDNSPLIPNYVPGSKGDKDDPHRLPALEKKPVQSTRGTADRAARRKQPVLWQHMHVRRTSIHPSCRPRALSPCAGCSSPLASARRDSPQCTHSGRSAARSPPLRRTEAKLLRNELRQWWTARVVRVNKDRTLDLRFDDSGDEVVKRRGGTGEYLKDEKGGCVDRAPLPPPPLPKRRRFAPSDGPNGRRFGPRFRGLVDQPPPPLSISLPAKEASLCTKRRSRRWRFGPRSRCTAGGRCDRYVDEKQLAPGQEWDPAVRALMHVKASLPL